MESEWSQNVVRMQSEYSQNVVRIKKVLFPGPIYSTEKVFFLLNYRFDSQLSSQRAPPNCHFRWMTNSHAILTPRKLHKHTKCKSGGWGGGDNQINIFVFALNREIRRCTWWCLVKYIYNKRCKTSSIRNALHHEIYFTPGKT